MKKYLKNLTLPTACAIHLVDALEDPELDKNKLTNAATGVLIGLFNAASIIDDDRDTNMQIRLSGKSKAIVRAFNLDNKKMNPKMLKKIKEIKKIDLSERREKPRQTQSFGKAPRYQGHQQSYPQRGRGQGRGARGGDKERLPFS
eukprot:TRINITY_DN8600_c0_g3_i1.p2 TRINITY_DN8600_c0_g3~~TRINITY_DN8600_c0_g3_i1.p2  ORF type:complete len:145 (-),score=23.77 TRINITY_DN8600_c0_g3_i1:1273-1707(-)